MYPVFSVIQVHDVTSGSAWTQGEHRQEHCSQVKTRVVDYGVILQQRLQCLLEPEGNPRLVSVPQWSVM